MIQKVGFGMRERALRPEVACARDHATFDALCVHTMFSRELDTNSLNLASYFEAWKRGKSASVRSSSVCSFFVLLSEELLGKIGGSAVSRFSSSKRERNRRTYLNQRK